MKFKVGDRVRVVKVYGTITHYNTGQIGTVVSITLVDTYPVEVKLDDSETNHFKEEELELVTPEVQLKKFAGWLKEKGL